MDWGRQNKISIIDQEEKVIQKGNLRDQLFLVNSGALISKMRVIRASRGAFACNLGLKPRFPKI